MQQSADKVIVSMFSDILKVAEQTHCALISTSYLRYRTCSDTKSMSVQALVCCNSIKLQLLSPVLHCLLHFYDSFFFLFSFEQNKNSLALPTKDCKILKDHLVKGERGDPGQYLNCLNLIEMNLLALFDNDGHFRIKQTRLMAADR